MKRKVGVVLLKIFVYLVFLIFFYICDINYFFKDKIFYVLQMLKLRKKMRK